MKTKKIKQLTNLLLLLPLCVALLGSGCNDEDNLETKTQLIGKWIEIEPFSDDICDTIVFKENNTIELYYPIQGWTYSLPSSDTIAFANPAKLRTKKCYFTFNSENELTIFNFYDRTITSQIKNITFEKIN